MAETLSAERLQYELRGLGGWVYGMGMIVRTFTFGDSGSAGAFESAARLEIDTAGSDVERSADPHEVHIGLHSGGNGVSGEDIDIAHRIDALRGKT